MAEYKRDSKRACDEVSNNKCQTHREGQPCGTIDMNGLPGQEMPLVSVIVPAYNIEDYIAECIGSIQRQTYQNLQIILVDDGSCDNTGRICDEYARLDTRVEVIHKKNGGLVSARKAGLEAAKGVYIGFVDGDDSIDRDMYQKLVSEIVAYDVDFVHSGYWENTVKRSTNEKAVLDLSKNRTELLENLLLEPEHTFISYSIWSKLFRAEMIKKSYRRVPDRCSYGEDMVNLCVCVLECSSILILDEAFYRYRIRRDSLSHKNDRSKIKNVFVLYEELADILSLYGYYREEVMNRFLWNTMLLCMGQINRFDFQITLYYYGDIEQLHGKRVVIYGAGMVGKDYYAQISRYRDCKIVAWVDKNPQKFHYPNVRVDDIDVMDTAHFDMVLIAVDNEAVMSQIYNYLTEKGIPKHKIYWSKPRLYVSDKSI